MKKAKRKKLNKKNKIILFTIIGILFVISICFGVSAFFKSKKVENNIPKIFEENEIPNLKILNLNSNSRPIAVMINNIGVAREVQTGLQDAYIVYEMIVEGGLTRLMAIYKDANTAKIGSIRSSRHYYLDYALENDAIYVHWGYSEFAMSDINKLKVNNVNGLIYGNQYFWKDNSLKVATEHRAFSSMELIQKGIEKLGYRNTTDEKPLLTYSVDAIDVSKLEGAIPASHVDIRYSKSVTSTYDYDTEKELYKRSVNGKAHVDAVTKEQNTAKNIITYQVKNTTINGDYKDRQDLETVGSGEGYFISNGYAVPIKWSKASRTARTVYQLLNGTELTVNDGNTYIQIQPVGEELTIS